MTTTNHPRSSGEAISDALEQCLMALTGYLPAHRNAVTDAAIENARAALAQRAGMGEDAIRQLIERHADEIEQNAYAYFELAYTRQTEWMAWICSKPREDDPQRKVIARGQGATPDEACRAAMGGETP